MGRITVFTRPDDLNSRRLCKELARRSLPYVEINVAAYPYKLKELEAALGDTPASVPHVFFNTRYVGGLSSCLAELQQYWDRPSSKRYTTALDKYQAEIETAFDPTNAHLTLPNEQQQRPNQQQQEEEREPPALTRKLRRVIELPNGTATYVRPMTEQLREWIPLEKCCYQNKMYTQSFTGQTLVAALQKILPTSTTKEEACQVAKQLCAAGLVRHVCFGLDPSIATTTAPFLSSFEDSDKQVYRLQCDAEPHVLNSYLIWPSSSSSSSPSDGEETYLDPLQLVDNLHRLCNVMELSSLDPEDGLLNAQHAVRLTKFAKLEEAMCELQPSSLKAALCLLDEPAMTAFSLNLWFLLVRVANLKVGIPTTTAARLHWLSHVEFFLAGDVYTLQDWLDVLLGKAAFLSGSAANHASFASSGGHGSGSWSYTYGDLLQRGQAEETSSYSSDHFYIKQDKRILLALYSHGPYYGGSQWSTSFARFSPDKLEEQLESAAKVFCLQDSHVYVDRREHKLTLLAPVFQKDAKSTDMFWGGCSKESGLPQAILPYLTGQKRLDLTLMIRSGKNIAISYVEPECGVHTISGPWYRKILSTTLPKKASNKCSSSSSSSSSVCSTSSASKTCMLSSSSHHSSNRGEGSSTGVSKRVLNVLKRARMKVENRMNSCNSCRLDGGAGGEEDNTSSHSISEHDF